MARHFDSLLLDANCLLNLYATGRLREITVALPYRFRVADYVVEHEALFIWRPGPTDARDVQEPVDLTPLLEESLIQLMCLEHPAEEATYVGLAAHLDDGEAITGALAFTAVAPLQPTTARRVAYLGNSIHRCNWSPLYNY